MCSEDCRGLDSFEEQLAAAGTKDGKWNSIVARTRRKDSICRQRSRHFHDKSAENKTAPTEVERS